jgi:hypothetical protein
MAIVVAGHVVGCELSWLDAKREVLAQKPDFQAGRGG